MKLSHTPLRRKFHVQRLLSLCLLTGLLGGCQTTSEPEDTSAFEELMPRSILVLPPTNESVEVNASYSYLTTMTRPLAEKGFYVFPVALVDVLMKENGLPQPEDMHTVSLEKIDEVFGADAVMYVHIKEFGQKFELLKSVTRVEAEARLVDVASGTELWRDDVKVAQSNNSNNQYGLLGALVEAAVAQVVSEKADNTHPAARVANQQLVNSMLLGPLHPGFAVAEEGDEAITAAAESAAAEAEAGAAEQPAAQQ